jgi:hypothetical protein
MRIYYVMVLALVGACAGSGDDASDGEADVAPQQPADGKADGIDFTGLYHISSSTRHSNDITTLELRAPITMGANAGEAQFVRSRCYHTGCALELPQTNDYDLYTSSSGKTYVRFYNDEIWLDADGNIQSQKVVDDVYEIKPTSKGVELRKSHTKRWFSLFAATLSSQCANTGGTWDGSLSDCACPGAVPGMPPATIFVPGAGGCIALPGSDESACDAAHGMWTDDDSTLIGTYCVCGVGRYDDAAGSCSAI